LSRGSHASARAWFHAVDVACQFVIPRITFYCSRNLLLIGKTRSLVSLGMTNRSADSVAICHSEDSVLLSEEAVVVAAEAGPSLRLYGVYCVRSWVVYCDGAGMEGRRFASAMVHGRTSREFPHPTTNVDEESSGRCLRFTDRRFGYKLTSVGVHPGSAYLTTKERSCQPH